MGVLAIKKKSIDLDKGSKSRSKIIEISDSQYKSADELFKVL